MRVIVVPRTLAALLFVLSVLVTCGTAPGAAAGAGPAAPPARAGEPFTEP